MRFSTLNTLSLVAAAAAVAAVVAIALLRPERDAADYRAAREAFLATGVEPPAPKPETGNMGND